MWLCSLEESSAGSSQHNDLFGHCFLFFSPFLFSTYVQSLFTCGCAELPHSNLSAKALVSGLTARLYSSVAGIGIWSVSACTTADALGGHLATSLLISDVLTYVWLLGWQGLQQQGTRTNNN